MFENFGGLLSTTAIVAGLGGSIVGIVKTLPNKIWSLIKHRYGYSISIDSRESERCYANLNTWLLNLNKPTIKNHINIKTTWIRGEYSAIHTLDYGLYMIFYKGTLISINKTKNNDNSAGGGKVIDYLNIDIFGRHAKEIKEEILTFGMKPEFDNNINERKFIEIQLLNSNGDIDCFRKPKRNVDTVFSPYKQKIFDYLDKWKNSKEIYEKLGIPYKTGILLYGEPGTGKTTLAKMIASYLDFDLMVITDASYCNKIARNVSEKTVILLEDFDCTLSGKRNDNKPSTDIMEEYEKIGTKNLLGDVLNVLDGVGSPENIIFVATTNHLDDMDPALIRKGRFDLQLEIEPLDREEAWDMVKSFKIDDETGKEILRKYDDKINPSSLQADILEVL